MVLKFAAFFFICYHMKVTNSSCENSPDRLNCSFRDHNLCSGWHVMSGNKYWDNFTYKDSGEIKSDTWCPKSNSDACLNLFYIFVLLENDVLNFTVAIMKDHPCNSTPAEVVKSWSVSTNTSINDWLFLQTNFKFDNSQTKHFMQISVSSKTIGSKVGIRDLLYYDSPCSTTTTTSSASFKPNTTSSATSSTTTSASPLEGSSNDVGAIVGAIIAVIILVVAGVVVFILLRRRRDLHFWKSCFKGKTDNSARTHNVGLSGLPSASVLGRHTTLDSGGGASSTDDFDSDADSFDISFSPSVPYANINKPANRNNTITGPYDVAELPPAELAPGFEYNHLDLAKKPVKKIGTKSADNYDHIATSKKGVINAAYSLATNPDGQNSAVASDGPYQEPLKATSVYVVIDSEKGNGESTDGQDIYHVPNEEDKTNYAEIEESASVYHEPNEASARTTNSGYYNVDFASGNVPPPQASVGVYNVPTAQVNTAEGIYDISKANASKPPPSTKPTGINQAHKPGTKKPSAPPKPTHPAPAKPQIAQSKPSATHPKSDAGNSVYHVLHTSSKGETATNGAAAASSNYEFAESITVSGNDNIPSSSVYNLASATGNRSHPKELLSSAQSSSNNDDYNSLDLEGNKLSQKSAPADMEGGIYSHLTDSNKETYNEMDRHKRTEVIDGEYSHLQQL